MKNILNNLMTSMVVVAGIAWMTTSLCAADAPEVSKLFADARTHSSQLSADWKAYTRQPNLTWTSDAAEVTHMKEEVGAIAKDLTGLSDFRKQASPSQAAAIDQITEVMEEIAEVNMKAIDFLTSNQKRMSGKDYKSYLDANSDTSSRQAALVSQLVDYASHKMKFDEAKRTLELASNK